MFQHYLIGAVSFISFLHQDHFIHAFAASSIRTTITTSYDVSKRTTTTTTTTTSPSSLPFQHVITSIYSSRHSFYDNDEDKDDEEEEEEYEYDVDEDLYMNFDFNSAREQLETLVGAGGVGGGGDDDQYQQQQQQQQQQKTDIIQHPSYERRS